MDSYFLRSYMQTPLGLSNSSFLGLTYFKVFLEKLFSALLNNDKLMTVPFFIMIFT